MTVEQHNLNETQRYTILSYEGNERVFFYPNTSDESKHIIFENINDFYKFLDWYIKE